MPQLRFVQFSRSTRAVMIMEGGGGDTDTHDPICTLPYPLRGQSFPSEKFTFSQRPRPRAR